MAEAAAASVAEPQQLAAVSDMYSVGGGGQQAPSGVEERLVDDTVGRGLFATRQFAEDEVIFEELPVVSCQFLYNKEYGYRACDHCLKSLEDAESNVRRLAQDPAIVLPHKAVGAQQRPVTACPHCGVEYCSAGCRNTAWCHYHRTLCPGADLHSNRFHDLQQEWKRHHFPPETMSVMLVARLLAGVLQSEDPERANAALRQYCHVTSDLEQRASHKLLGEHFKQHINTLREMLTTALGAPVQLKQWLSAEGFQSLLALVASNGQGVGSSPLGCWVSRCDQLQLPPDDRAHLDQFIDQLYERLEQTVGSFLNTEGSGLYRLQSRINHSCRPNATPAFPHNSHRMALTALRPILPGEQIYISYLDECTLSKSRHSRHKILRENYVFVCRCERCLEEEGEPDVTSDEDEEDDDQGED